MSTALDLWPSICSLLSELGADRKHVQGYRREKRDGNEVVARRVVECAQMQGKRGSWSASLDRAEWQGDGRGCRARGSSSGY